MHVTAYSLKHTAVKNMPGENSDFLRRRRRREAIALSGKRRGCRALQPVEDTLETST
jgi:hypothetical protein